MKILAENDFTAQSETGVLIENDDPWHNIMADVFVLHLKCPNLYHI